MESTVRAEGVRNTRLPSTAGVLPAPAPPMLLLLPLLLLPLLAGLPLLFL